MKLPFARLFMLLLASMILAEMGDAQAQTNRGNRGTNNQQNKAPAFKLPDDPRLIELHKALVRDAEKLALEYQKSKQLDKARVVYGEIIRFVPTYGKAANALNTIRGTEATAERKVVEISANKGWQDAGIEIAEGRPLVFRVFDGKWHLLMDYPVGPEGIEIPKELRQFNLGSLIGIIVPPGMSASEAASRAIAAASDREDGNEMGSNNAQPAEGAPASADSAAPPSSSDSSSSENAEKEKQEHTGPKPFLVGSKLDLIAPNSGHLYLRMYDAQPDDNLGKLKVTVTGTFGPPPTYAGGKETTLGPAAETESK